MNDLWLPRRLKAGAGSFRELGDVAEELQVRHLFVVTGSLLKKEPFQSRFEAILQESGLEAAFFSGMKGEPTTEHLAAALTELKQSGADCVVAVGGGSVMDLAKALSVMAVNDGATLDSIPKMERLKRLPLIALPTTAGTGSEATKVTVITDIENKVKKNPGHERLIPDAAILDPALTVTLPKQLTAYTGLDALAHAMEAYVSTRATPMSDLFALEAIRIIGKWLPEAYENGVNLEARENMLLGSYYAGIAFSNASTNLAHAAARPLGARFHIPHGLSVALLMPFVMEFGLGVCEDRYAEIGRSLGCEGDDSVKLAMGAVEMVRQFNDMFRIWEDGAAYFKGRDPFEESVSLLIKDALSGNGIATNRRIPGESDIEKMYSKLLMELQVHR